MMHTCLVGILRSILRDFGLPDMAVVTESRGLRSTDTSRHGDFVVLDFFAEGRHLVIDAVVTTVYRKNRIQRMAFIPGYAAKQVEDRKLLADRTSTQTIAAAHGGPRVLVPVAIEDGGRLGAHALAPLKALATVALEKSCRHTTPPRGHVNPPSSSP